MLGVYIHIPFCQRKCSYCAFSSFVSSEEEKEKYVEFLLEEIETFSKKKKGEKCKKIDTIFIGGGTPSLLDTDLLKKIVEKLKLCFIFDKNIEFTIECNPNSLTIEKLAFYKQLGINRLSLGIQSLDDDQLKFINRLHDKNDAIKAVKESLSVFDNVSCDLLIGIKGMEKEKYLSSLKTLIDLGIKHISTYMLQIEEGTPLYQIVKTRNILPNEEECIEVYNANVSYLKKHGFNQYEISNFAKEGYECKHNLKYWTGEEYIGFGLSAHSYINGERVANANNFNDYYNKKLAMRELLTKQQKIEEHIMLGLRCKKGIDKKYLKSLGYDIEKNNYLKEYIQNNILIENERIYLNPDFYGVNNYIIVHLLP